MRIGRSNLRSVFEIQGEPLPVAGLCFGWDPDLIAPHAEWLYPDHVDPITQTLRLAHHSWLLTTPELTVLIDPCIGNDKPRETPPNEYYDRLDTPWLERLEAAGSHPDQIDLVICTHLHPDHCGWNTRRIDGTWVPTFPNARYVLSAPEVAFWQALEQQPETYPEFSYNLGVFTDSVAPVLDAGQALVLEAGEPFAHGFTTMETAGHTAGHWSVIYEDDLDGICFSGDVVHTPVHVLFPEWSLYPGPGSNFDHDRAAKARRKVLEHCANSGHLLAPAHFQAPHACRVTHGSDGHYVIQWESET